MDLWVIFLTGLTVGGVSCMAVQGGLLTSVIASREEEDLESGNRKKHSVLPTLAFLTTKLIAYVILGLVLGLFGQGLQISDNARIWVQLFAGIYMLAVALNLLNIHPIFRYVIIQPPRFLTKLVRNQAKSKDLFAPAFLGALTIFIPCGTTLAMEALAISSGSPFLGAATLGAFVLGTSPLFFILGYLTTLLGDAFRAKFLKIAAFLVIYLGITTVNSALVLGGSPITLSSLKDLIPIQVNLDGDESFSDSSVQVTDGVQVVDIKVFPNGYNPSSVKVKAGIPIKMNLITTGGLGCTSAFVIPQLGIKQRLQKESMSSIDIPAQNPGKITWTCSMGMYFGLMEVI